jgi:hypothetical protein
VKFYLFEPLEGWAVVNDLGHVVPCTDGGKTRHHAAIWDSEASAEIFAGTMRQLNPARGEYRVQRVIVEPWSPRD